MTTHVPARLDIQPVTPVIGAEVQGIDLRQPLDPATVAELSEALVQWKVLFFRDQQLTRDQHVAFGEAFGALTPGHPIQVAADDRDEVLVVDTREAQGHVGLRRARSVRTAAPHDQRLAHRHHVRRQPGRGIDPAGRGDPALRG